MLGRYLQDQDKASRQARQELMACLEEKVGTYELTDHTANYDITLSEALTIALFR